MHITRYAFVRWCVTMVVLMPTTVFAQKDLYSVRTVVPSLMWTETYRAGPYSTDEQIREAVTNPSKYKQYTFPIRIPSTTFNKYIGFFKQNKANVSALLVLGATNGDIRELAALDSLVSLDLPVCKAVDFQPLGELERLVLLRVANPNLKQLEERKILCEMNSLRRLTLYNVADLQAAVELPGLDPALSPEDQGLTGLALHSSEWNPTNRIEWPRSLSGLQQFSVHGERFGMAYVSNHQYAMIDLGRHKVDDLATCSTILRDLIEKSGFFDHRKVTNFYLTSRYVVMESLYAVEYDPTDISPLRAFSDLRHLILTGDCYGFEHLKDVPLESIDFPEASPFPSKQAVEAMSKHPTLKTVTKTIESATEKVLWRREG